MRLEEALYAYLGPKLADHLYPLYLPQHVVLPAVVLTPISVERLHTFQENTSWLKQRIQFSCMASSYQAAVEVAQIIQSELQRCAGPLSDLWIAGVWLRGETSDLEADTSVYRVVLEFEFLLEEG